MKLKPLTTLAAATIITATANAQVNAQLFYDFGENRKYLTLTLEMFKNDKWGNTYFFVDNDFNYDKMIGDNNIAPGGTYTEIARCLNFWQNNTKLAPFSLHVEYNGGITRNYPINNAWLFGVDYFIHSNDFRNTLNLKVLCKFIRDVSQDAPFQFTVVWGMKDLLDVKGLAFSGFADFWWENHYVDYYDATGPYEKSVVFITEPQLWYAIGQHFGCDNLNVGTEIELSANFGSTGGFKCRPCLGLKWVF